MLMPSVEDFLLDLPAKEQPIAIRLREIILESIPDVEERLSYGVPYFYRFSRICFIWPASAPNSAHDDGVLLGFCRANLLSNENGLFEMGHRKEVGIVQYHSLLEIDENVILEALYEAVIVDEELGGKRKGGLNV